MGVATQRVASLEGAHSPRVAHSVLPRQLLRSFIGGDVAGAGSTAPDPGEATAGGGTAAPDSGEGAAGTDGTLVSGICGGGG